DRRCEQAHEAGEHDEVGLVLGDRLGELVVPRGAVRMVAQCDSERGDAGGPGALHRGASGHVGARRDDLPRELGVVQDRLERRAEARTSKRATPQPYPGAMLGGFAAPRLAGSGDLAELVGGGLFGVLTRLVSVLIRLVGVLIRLVGVLTRLAGVLIRLVSVLI